MPEIDHRQDLAAHGRRRVVPAFAAALLMLAALAGCSSPAEDSSDDGGTGGTSVAEGEPVVVSFMYPDLEVIAQAGFAESLGDIDAIFAAVVDDVNEDGGIAGHPIEYRSVIFDLFTDGDNMRACLEATQDLGSFVVLGGPGVYGEPVACVTDENQTLLFGSDGYPAEYYEAADGRLFSLPPSKDTAQVSLVEGYVDELRAAPFAVLSSNDTAGDDAAVRNSLLPALTEAGVEPATVITLDTDEEVAASQIPVEIAELRDSGVEAIVATSGFASAAPFAQALDEAGLQLQWYGTDAAGFASDLYAAQMDSAQMEGARAVTASQLGGREAGFADPEVATACRERVSELLGREIEVGSEDEGAAFLACNFIDTLAAAGEVVDGELTTASLSAALQELTELDLAGFGPAGFGDGDFEAANAVRRVTWSSDCDCWTAEGEYLPLADG